MPPIKSINAPREISADSLRQFETPNILTQAIPEPSKSTTTYFTPERIVGMTVFQDQLWIATENGVYVKDDQGVFRRRLFEIVEEPNEN